MPDPTAKGKSGGKGSSRLRSPKGPRDGHGSRDAPPRLRAEVRTGPVLSCSVVVLSPLVFPPDMLFHPILLVHCWSASLFVPWMLLPRGPSLAAWEDRLPSLVSEGAVLSSPLFLLHCLLRVLLFVGCAPPPPSHKDLVFS